MRIEECEVEGSDIIVEKLDFDNIDKDINIDNLNEKIYRKME